MTREMWVTLGYVAVVVVLVVSYVGVLALAVKMEADAEAEAETDAEKRFVEDYRKRRALRVANEGWPKTVFSGRKL